MGILDYFSSKKTTAKQAKERLQIIVAHERKGRQSSKLSPAYFNELQQELLAVIRKYVSVNDQDIVLKMDQNDDHEILDINITLSDLESE